MKLVIGSDHGGYQVKQKLIEDLKDLGHEVIDVGTHSEESCDYPIFAAKAAQNIINLNAEYGILICSSGEGISIAANKLKGIRCGLGYNDEVAKLMRQHNHANMIAFGAKFMEYDDILRRVKLFLETPEEHGRHDRRVDLINELD